MTAEDIIIHTLGTLPGFGPVLSASIIVEIGHAGRFDYDQDKVAKYAGLRWRQSRLADF